MAGKWNDEGENNLLDCYLKGATRPSFYIGLFKNVVEPVEGATLASGITEVTGTGYARIQLQDADWTVAADLATHLQKTFTAGEDWGDVYGYFICTAATGTAGKVICCEAFSDGPYNVLSGGSIKITSKITAA